MALLKFTYTHVKYVLENMTTIDEMRQKNGQADDEFLFNLGVHRNIQQVFGTVIWTYPFPFFIKSGYPLGNGVDWNVGSTGIHFETEERKIVDPYIQATPKEEDIEDIKEQSRPPSTNNLHNLI